MKLMVKKENQSFTIEGQRQTNEYSFGIEVNGIKTKEDIQEIIHQCQLVENQLTDELTLVPVQNSIKGDFADQLNG